MKRKRLQALLGKKLIPSALFQVNQPAHFHHTEPADLPEPNWQVLRSPEFKARGRQLISEMMKGGEENNQRETGSQA